MPELPFFSVFSARPVVVWVALVIGVGVAGRLLPHPPNVSPILALSLVSGMLVRQPAAAAAIPLSALTISDLVLGVYDPRIMIVVYAGLIMPVLAGPLLRHRGWIAKLAVCSILGSSVFFLISNLAVFVFSGAYPLTVSGLVACYVAAVPFYVNALAGDLVWCMVFAASGWLMGLIALR